MRRRIFLALAVAACARPALADPGPAGASAAPSGPHPSDLLGASGDPAFLTWLNGYYARAVANGFPREVVDRELSGLSPDPRVIAHNASQPEFALPVSDYVNNQVTPGVIAKGLAKRAGVPQLSGIEAKYGVPADILTAIWAMESAFGAFQGEFDVVRSFATLAAEAPARSDWAQQELDACLKIIVKGAATRAQLKGSWAGAMGQTQLLPSSFLDTAVDADGDGRPDIWGSPADALASAANLLVKGGWRRGEGWAREVILPKGFDYSLTEGPKQPPSWWEAKGVHRAAARSWSAADAAAPGQLILPAGAGGPAFLVFPNHFAIRTYNNALAYALAIGLLADRFGGGGPLVTPWPHETPLSLTDRMAAQSALARLGYNPGPVDGAIGAGTRQALRAWQQSRGLLADGYLSPAVLARLKGDGGSAAPPPGH
jgi:lytic murein transglycosylase